MSVPLRQLADQSRVMIAPERMPEQVDLYSIPALDALGQAELAAASTIDSGKLWLQGGEVLVSRLNPRKSRVHLVPNRLDRFSVCSPEFVVLVPRHGVDPRFIGYVLRSELVRQQLDANVRSATRSHQRVDPSVLMAVRVSAPPFDVQRCVADFLDDQVARIDSIVDARRAQLGALALEYSSWLAETVDRELANGARSLRRHVTRIEQGWSPLSASSPAMGGEPGVIKLGAVRRGEFRASENKAFSPDTSPDESYLIRRGDLLMTRANTLELVGDVAVVGEVGEARVYLSDLVYRVAVDGVDRDFVSAALRASRNRQLVSTIARGTSQSMAKLRGEDIADMLIPAASRARQQEIGIADREARIRLDSRSEVLARSIALLTEYKQSLITAAVTGEIDVTTASGSGIPA